MRKEPCRRWQFKTAAESRGDRPVLGEGEEAPRGSACHQRQKRSCYRRDAATCNPGESRWGSPFLLTRQFSTTDLHLNFGGQKGPMPRGVTGTSLAEHTPPSPAIAGAEGGRSVQQSRATCSGRVSVLQGFTLTCVGGRKKLQKKLRRSRDQLMLPSATGRLQRKPWDGRFLEER